MLKFGSLRNKSGIPDIKERTHFYPLNCRRPGQDGHLTPFPSLALARPYNDFQTNSN